MKNILLPTFVEYETDNGQAFGLYGEIHLYSQDESRFVSDRIDKYDVILSEGQDNMEKRVDLIALSLFYTPGLFAYAFGTDRVTHNDAKAIAKENGKRVENLNDCEILSYKQKLNMGIRGALSMPLAPFLFAKYRLQGDPSVVGSQAREKLLSNPKKFKKMYDKAGLYGNVKIRDEFMARKIADRIEQMPSKNILAICGAVHHSGISKNLESLCKLKEMERIVITNENGWKGLNKELG